MGRRAALLLALLVAGALWQAALRTPRSDAAIATLPMACDVCVFISRPARLSAHDVAVLHRFARGFSANVSVQFLFKSLVSQAAICPPDIVCRVDATLGAASDSLPLLRIRLGASSNTAVDMDSMSALARLRWIHQLPRSALHRWPNATTSVRIITQHRIDDLRRLCASLTAADYLSDTVPLRFAVDGDNRHAAGHAAVLAFIAGFHWPHGPVTVQRRDAQAGLEQAVRGSWDGAGDAGAVLLEDDVSVSPAWYHWVKRMLLTFHPAPAELMGISLYTPRIVETVSHRPRLALPASASPAVLYQVPCSWGALYFPAPWRSLLTAPPSASRIPGSTTNTWHQSWKRRMFELMYARGWVLLYPSFRNETSFATNHLSAGEHVGPGSRSSILHRAADYTVPLFAWDEAAIEALAAPMPPLRDLPVLNMFAQRRPSLHDLRAAGAGWGAELKPALP